MQSTNLPSKYLVPFAANDSAKVELPVTTSTVGRASLSLGFPPITGQPPEAGGQPPQLEDFNGGINQISRVAWWAQLGGMWPFDATFAADANIAGYPQGAVLQSADNAGAWLSLAQNNTANPDVSGAGWVPGWAYGVTGLTGLTGGSLTVTPAQAMKRRITLAGTLTSNQTIILPAWLYDWTIFNNTSGAFSVTVKTPAGAGVILPQNGAPTAVYGDGTNIATSIPNVPSPPVGSVRNGAMLVAAASATATWTADQIIVANTLTGTSYTLANVSLSINLASTGAGGMDTGTAPASSFVGIYLIYNPGTGVRALLGVNAGPAKLAEVYTGANLPAGYTHSALISVWPTTAASLLDIGTQIDRTVNVTTRIVINVSGGPQLTIAPVVATTFPKNARALSGSLSVQSTVTSAISINIYAAGASVGQQALNVVTSGTSQVVGAIAKLNITIPQTVYWSSTNSAGTPTYGFNATSYDF